MKKFIAAILPLLLLAACDMSTPSQVNIRQVQLREAVTSPGGTTIAAIRELEVHGVRAALLAAIEAACKRSEELGRANRRGRGLRPPSRRRCSAAPEALPRRLHCRADRHRPRTCQPR